MEESGSGMRSHRGATDGRYTYMHHCMRGTNLASTTIHSFYLCLVLLVLALQFFSSCH